MKQVALWQISEDGPGKLAPSGIGLEKHLEDWIEVDPSLLEAGLRVVGRQVLTEAGTLDLLAVDPQGQFVVIELKRETVYRDSITQALDYAACVTQMTRAELGNIARRYLTYRGSNDSVADILGEVDSEVGDHLDVRVVVAGLGRDPGLNRLVNFLAPGVAVTVVSFQSYQLADGQQVLVRELTEAEMSFAEERAKELLTPEGLCELADANGIGTQFRTIIEAGQRHGLHLRPYKKR